MTAKPYDTPYVLLKPDGTVSSPNVYSAISRLSGHYGGHIVQAALLAAYHYDGSAWIAATQETALAALLPEEK